MYTVESVEAFWNAWQFTPLPGCGCLAVADAGPFSLKFTRPPLRACRRTMFKVVQGVGRPSVSRGDGRGKRVSRVNGYAFFKVRGARTTAVFCRQGGSLCSMRPVLRVQEPVKPYLESEIEGVRVNRSRWTLEDDVKGASVVARCRPG